VTSEDAVSSGGNTFAPSFSFAPASVTFGAGSVTVPAGGSAVVTAAISPNAALPDRAVYGGWVVFTPDDEGQAIRVPFAGFKGDYQSIRVLVPTANGFPWLARLDPATGSFVKQADGASFTFTGTDFPHVLVHLDHQSRILQIEVLDAATGQSFHLASRDEFVVRNSTATGFFDLPWDGTTTIGAKNGLKALTVPAGQYVLRVSVLKALGDETNPAHWETWTSPAFHVVR
jgi:minor extracellular serine protease Vpr